MELAHSLLLNEEAFKRIPDTKRPVFVFEWLRFLDKVLGAAQKSDIKAGQKKLVEQLTNQISESPGPPTRKLLARCLATLFSVGDTFDLFETINKCNDIIRNKDDSPSYLPTRLAAVACLGAMYEKLGRMVGRSYEETVQVLIKSLRNSESQGRTEVMLTLEKVVAGLGSAGNSCHKDIYKAARQAMTDRSMSVRYAAAKNEAYIGYTTETPHWRISSHNNCETSYMKDMVIVDGKGRQHNRMVEFCSCECEAVRLVRYKLWPSTSKFPKLAFHFDLLDWLNGLLLESHVSVKAFCESLKARSSKHSRSCVNLKIQDIYKVLITETSEEYRHFIYKREHPFHDDGTECPCCFLSSRKVYSLDADFQLVRKATAGREWDHPKHQNHFFFDQNLVDNFMNDYQGDTTKPDVDCSEFQAGSMLRSKGRYKKLSETAVFGSTCRHEYPKYFFSLKHGERLGYSVFLIKKLLEEKEESEKLYILYDIACSLSNHLKKKSEESLLSETTFSIPIFHAYGHKVSCQVLYGPRRVNGLGLTDGESLERLWSYLGKFSNITKETTPENRIDILVDGLMYYGLKLREKLGTSLINKIKKAEELEKTSTETLAEILQPLSDASEETVLTWIQEEKQANTGNNENNQKVDLSLEEEYVQALDKLSRNEFVEGDNKYKCLKRTIRSLEKKLSLQKQWCLTDTPCLTYLLSVQEKQRQMLMNILQSLVSERAFLLDLIKKYARGQAISIRLSKQVKAVNEKLKQKIRDYNLIGGSKQHLPIHLTFDEVKDSNADMWITTEFDDRDDNIPISIKRQAINLKCLKDRAAEEQTLVKEEMLSVINYYRRQHTLLFQSFTLSLNGERAYAIKEGLFYETQISELLQKFTEYISNVNAPTTFKNLLGISSCSVECDTIDSDSSISDNSDYTDDSDDDTYDSDNNLM